MIEETRQFLHDFYQQYGFYPPENIDSWEEWNESQDYVDYLQKRASQPRKLDKPIIFNN